MFYPHPPDSDLGLFSILPVLTSLVSSSDCIVLNTIYILMSPAGHFSRIQTHLSNGFLDLSPWMSYRHCTLKCLMLLFFPEPTSLQPSNNPISTAQGVVRSISYRMYNCSTAEGEALQVWACTLMSDCLCLRSFGVNFSIGLSCHLYISDYLVWLWWAPNGKIYAKH